jgi:GAF domain-containing protein
MVTVSISIGVASLPPDCQSAEILVRRSDQALYSAKREGKNRVVLWSPTHDRIEQRTDEFAGVITGDPVRDQRNVQFLFEIIGLSRAGDPDLLAKVLASLVRYTRTERGILFEWDAASSKLSIRAARNRGGEDPSEPDIRCAEGLVRQSVESGRSVVWPDVAGEDAAGAGRAARMEPLGLAFALSSPIVVQGEVRGAIYVDDRVEHPELEVSDVVYFEGIALQLAHVLEHD